MSKDNIALYRKYRPKLLSEIAGQDHVKKTIQNAVVSGRELSHALLFTGPQGTGKTTFARIISCIVNSDPYTTVYDVENGICANILSGSCPDIHEIDAASKTSIDNVREIRQTARLSPMIAKRRVFIIDECLPKESLITLPDGSKKTILEIIKNDKFDKVLSVDLKTKTVEPKKIVRKIKIKNDKKMKLIKIKDSKGKIRSVKITDNHSVFINDNNDKIKVSNLKAGDKMKILVEE